MNIHDKFKPISKLKKRLKVGVFGARFKGKTWFALSFPKVAVIDTQRGMAFYASRFPEARVFDIAEECEEEKKRTGVLPDTKKKVEMILEAIYGIAENPGDRQALVIDCQTQLWDWIQEAFQDYIKGPRKKTDGEDLFSFTQPELRDWKTIKHPLKRLYGCLFTFPLHWCMTFEEGIQWEEREVAGRTKLVKTGVRMLAEGRTDFLFDILLRLYTHDRIHMGEVHKDRTGLYAEGQVLENPSFRTWEPKLGDSPSSEEHVRQELQDTAEALKGMQVPTADMGDTESQNALFMTLKAQFTAAANMGTGTITKQLNLMKSKGLIDKLKIEKRKELMEFVNGLLKGK